MLIRVPQTWPTPPVASAALLVPAALDLTAALVAKEAGRPRWSAGR